MKTEQNTAFKAYLGDYTIYVDPKGSKWEFSVFSLDGQRLAWEARTTQKTAIRAGIDFVMEEMKK